MPIFVCNIGFVLWKLKSPFVFFPEFNRESHYPKPSPSLRTSWRMDTEWLTLKYSTSLSSLWIWCWISPWMFTAVCLFILGCGRVVEVEADGEGFKINPCSFIEFFLCFAVCVMPLKPSEAKFCASCHFPSVVQLRPPSHEIRDMSVKSCENRLGNKHLSTWTIGDSLLSEQGIYFVLYNTFGQESLWESQMCHLARKKNFRTINKNHVALLFDATVRFRVTRQTVHPVCYLSERI